jgi:hypothetical protein
LAQPPKIARAKRRAIANVITVFFLLRITVHLLKIVSVYEPEHPPRKGTATVKLLSSG